MNSGGGPIVSSGERGEILLVDDSPSALSLLSTLLTEAGYRVREAPSGELALMTLKVRLPELVLLDVRMPDMDGFEVCRRMKADPLTRDVTVIFLSAQDDTADKVLGLQVGAVDFIAKTFPQSEIFARLDTHVALCRVKRTLDEERLSLEDRVRERTEEARALERALSQAKKMEAVGLLAGGIAHDFNHLLSLILGFAQFAQAALASGKLDKLNDYLAEVLKAGAEGQTVVAQLLAFSRAEESAAEPLDLGPILSEVTDTMRQFIGEHNQLSLAVDADLPQVLIKPGQVKQVVTNLLLNARDALGATGRIEIRLQRGTSNSPQECASCRKGFQGEHIRLSVKDNGCGIAPEIVDKIFDPFFTTKDIGKGSGLGLPMVHGIIHSAGGHIQLQSTVGSGTDVLVWIPIWK